MILRTVLSAVIFASGILPAISATAETQVSIASAIADLDRPPADKAHDAERKPADILAFAGIKPGDRVVDFGPDAGYWTRILSKLVGSQGKVYGFVPMVGPAPWSKAAQDAAKAAGKAAPDNPIAPVLEIQNALAYRNVTAIMMNVSAFEGTVSVPEQVDAAWTWDIYHDLHNKNDLTAPMDMAAVNKALFRTLKPGGTFLVVDRAAAEGTRFTDAERLDRSDPQAVKAEVLTAGFVFDGDSSLLADPMDDHTKPIPDASAGGRIDRFVLRFKKPRTAVGDERHKDNDLVNYYGNTFIFHPAKAAMPLLRIMWHPDHTYQQYASGSGELASGYWYSDADGHICQLHQSPAAQRGFATCHPFDPGAKDKKIGDVWTEAAQGTTWEVKLVRGYVLD